MLEWLIKAGEVGGERQKTDGQELSHYSKSVITWSDPK